MDHCTFITLKNGIQGFQSSYIYTPEKTTFDTNCDPDCHLWSASDNVQGVYTGKCATVAHLWHIKSRQCGTGVPHMCE